jgi:hypothetical protein
MGRGLPSPCEHAREPADVAVQGLGSLGWDEAVLHSAPLRVIKAVNQKHVIREAESQAEPAPEVIVIYPSCGAVA